MRDGTTRRGAACYCLSPEDIMNNIDNVTCFAVGANNGFFIGILDNCWNPQLPRCIEEGETVPQPEWNVPTESGFVPNKVGNKGINLFRFEISNSRCRSKPKKKKLGGGGASGGSLSFGIVIAKKFTSIFPGKNLFSAREKSVKIIYAASLLLA
jgi:hypothetical protein